MSESVDRRGVEPGGNPSGVAPGRPGVVPLDQQPILLENRQRSARESNSVPLLTREPCGQRTRGPFRSPISRVESSRRESNPRSLFVREVSLPLDHGTFHAVSLRVARVGFEPTDIGLRAPPEGWSRSLCQFAYRAIRAPSNVSSRVASRSFAGPGVEPRNPSL